MSGQVQGAKRIGATDSRSVLEVLYLAAQPSLRDDELEHLAGASELASELVQQVGVMANGVACLIAADGMASPGAGNFTRGEEVAALLHLIAQSMSQVEGLLYVAQEASYSRTQAATGRKATS